MFARKTYQTESFSKSNRIGKSTNRSKKSFRDHSTTTKRLDRSLKMDAVMDTRPDVSPTSPSMTSPIITICIGHDARVFAAHEEQLRASPFFARFCRSQMMDSGSKRINVPDELPEVFSCVLEYLYKGDYYPRAVLDKRRNTWHLEDAEATGRGQTESAIYHPGENAMILKDTLIYCAAEKYGLEELKRLALRKQGLQSGIQCSTILSSARFAYSHTPDTDAKLRSHYLALIIRSRATFKRSGTMQVEMELGGKMFFDLFVAMCNHMDDIASAKSTPR